jgi:hypothetical protein
VFETFAFLTTVGFMIVFVLLFQMNRASAEEDPPEGDKL